MTDDFLAQLDLLGVPVFSLPRQKGGAIKGRYRAPKGWQTSSPDQNDRVLAALRPTEGVGVLGGGAVDIIDVDPRNGGDQSLARLTADNLLPEPVAVVATPSGGWHVYVPALGLESSKPLPGIDLQSSGRFVLAPPTEGYRVLPRDEWPDLGQHPADAANRLRHVIGTRLPSPEAEAESPDAGTPPTPQELDKARAVLDKACREVRLAEGGRNNSVSRHLLPLYNFVLADCLDQDEVGDRLWEAVQDAPGDHPYTRAEFDASCESAMSKARPERPRVESPEADFDSLPDAKHDGVLDRFPRMSLAELLNPNQPPREYVVEPMILAGVSVAFVAPAGHRKSLIALGLAVAVAKGEPTFAGMTIPKARRVLYVDMENTPDDLRDRLLSFGLTPTDRLDRLVLLSLPALSPLDTKTGGDDLMAILDAYGMERGDLVVLDSYQRVTEAGENDSDTTRGYYRHTGVRLKARGLTVIRTDNTGKDVARGARGSSGKRDDVDVEYLMESHGDLVQVSTGKVRQRGVGELTIHVRQDADGYTTFSSDHTRPAQRRLDECVAWLDSLGLDARLGQDKAWAWIKGQGEPCSFSRAVVREAVAFRRDREADFEPIEGHAVAVAGDGLGSVTPEDSGVARREGAEK
ncbi:MAG: AAA family ATPase [Propionicimonas sp.]|uniref:AAA family ATPase n=1 Tax=Propionicimonas sp. TaxID=1955623 RepID=UPI003D0C8609